MNFAQDFFSLAGTWNGQIRANAGVTYTGSLLHSWGKRYTSELTLWLITVSKISTQPGGCPTPVRRVQWSHWLSLRRREKQIHGAELVKRWSSWRSWISGCKGTWLTQLSSGDREGAENLGSRAEMWDFWWDGRGQVLLDKAEHRHCHIIHAPGFSTPIHK